MELEEAEPLGQSQEITVADLKGTLKEGLG